LLAGYVYEAYTAYDYALVRGQCGADYRRAKVLAERLIDWMSAGYQLQCHPGGDIAVLVESVDGIPRDRVTYTAPRKVEIRR
jgi:hypothetical protein